MQQINALQQQRQQHNCSSTSYGSPPNWLAERIDEFTCVVCPPSHCTLPVIRFVDGTCCSKRPSRATRAQSQNSNVLDHQQPKQSRCASCNNGIAAECLDADTWHPLVE
ncbi:unnamed protein product [Ceratitis capitata]|uniref:(Mediterranean fruit fly) hypothetical protein n=1 Tax=Ceratitis capitata TaxID=7213 RepID=A0A811UIA2_CERCA|nr:unnamed protein product [Ceratitis capitata]